MRNRQAVSQSGRLIGRDRGIAAAGAWGGVVLCLIAAAFLLWPAAKNSMLLSDSPPAGPTNPDLVTRPYFTECAESLGVRFHHFNGMTGQWYFCEIVGAGSALFDYDNDGDLDLYLVQGTILEPGKANKDAKFPPLGDPPIQDRLLRNDLIETGKLGFTDVTAKSGIKESGYGMGVATGDFDRNGFVDLYVTNFANNFLYRNNGDGTFTDVTAATGTDDDRWSTSATFFDHDVDGDLDLFVCNYVNFRLHTNKPCYSESAARDYCGPKSFEPLPNRFFRNNGDGSFSDASAATQIARTYHGALGVVAVDITGDRRLDLFVANDGRDNELWIAQPDGTFTEEAAVRGVAFDSHGRALASMGVEAADFDNDGDNDLFTTHLTSELHTYYRNNGKGRFEDRSIEVGLKSRVFTGFGTSSFDFDNDGWLDLLTANGAVKTVEALATKGDPFPLHQPNQLFRNDRKGRFQNVTAEAGPAFELSDVSRGAATGDIDNDGDPDIVLTNNNGWVRILLNEVGSKSHWLGVRVRDSSDKVDLVGTVVEIKRQGAAPIFRRAGTDGSYCSANDPRVLAGLGSEAAVEYVRLRYLDGTNEIWRGLAGDRYHTLRRGSGEQEKK